VQTSRHCRYLPMISWTTRRSTRMSVKRDSELLDEVIWTQTDRILLPSTLIQVQRCDCAGMCHDHRPMRRQRRRQAVVGAIVATMNGDNNSRY
jgi:hypothetical protein